MIRTVQILLLGSLAAHHLLAQSVKVPKIWDEKALHDWALPIAALGIRPGHFTSKEYYRAPVENVRTYPMYHPDREPAGYWEWLRTRRPEPMVDRATLRSTADWVAAGERAFREVDMPMFRTSDPAIIARARDPKAYKNVLLLPDGSIAGRRWVVTSDGLMLTTAECTGCHIRVSNDGVVSVAGPGDKLPRDVRLSPAGTSTFDPRRFFPGNTIPQVFWRESTVPWNPDPRVENFLRMTPEELFPLSDGGHGGVFSRTNGSPYYQTKIPDLHTLRYSRYIDATATHRLRGPEDIARYMALVNTADSLDFGKHRFLAEDQRRVLFRHADEVLYAVGLYLLSLKPPVNPKAADSATIAKGEKIFTGQGCAKCHAPPDYTNGKLTLAQGYNPPADHPERENIMMVSVETDSGLALKTRKATGLYKVPSLRGLWYRPLLLHDGSVASLEEMFDPARLQSDHEPGGWKGPGVSKRSVPGHQFGLRLKANDKAALLAFLRSL